MGDLRPEESCMDPLFHAEDGSGGRNEEIGCWHLVFFFKVSSHDPDMTKVHFLVLTRLIVSSLIGSRTTS